MKQHILTPWKVRAALVAFTIAAGVPWAGCGSGASSSPASSSASAGETGQTQPQANVAKSKTGKGRLKADMTSRREHQKQLRGESPPSSP